MGPPFSPPLPSPPLLHTSVVVTTPEGHPSPVGVPAPSYYTHPPPPSSFGPTATETESLKLDKEKYQRMYEAKKKECNELLLRMNDLKGQVRREDQQLVPRCSKIVAPENEATL